MNELYSCDVIKDLIPLVKDGIASEESERIVNAHIKTCEECKKIFGEDEKTQAAAVDLKKSFGKFRGKLMISSAMVMMFGIFFGLSFTATDMIFYNTVIMPAIGALGYIIFGWKVSFIMPVVLFITHITTNFSGILTGTEHLMFMEVVLWTGIYSCFALLGALIMGLLHFALKKEK